MYSVVEQNLRSAMRCYGFIGNGSETREYPGLTIASSGLNVPVFNSAMLTSHPSNLDTLITTADLHYRTRKLGWTFWVCDDMVPASLRDRGMRTVFRSQGMSRIASPPGMYAEEISARVKPPAPLTFARVCTEDTRLEFAHIASIVFSLPFGTSKRIYGATGLWESPSYGWVGYFKGKAVAIVTIVIASDAIGVYSLGTLPEYQGRGFGETLLRHAIDDASQRTGLRRSVLQSTQQGINLYLRLGYRIVTNFSIYVREGCASF